SFRAEVEQGRLGLVRMQMGLHPDDFSWLLAPGESFQTPQCVGVFSQQGLGEMSRRFHKLYRERLVRGQWRDRTRPLLVNNWEATYFDFNEKRLLAIAQVGQDLGLDLLVI